MRFALSTFLFVLGCHQNAAPIPPDASSSSAATSVASSPTSNETACEAIRKRWEKELSRFVGQEHTCGSDEDCVCYGGPVCSNALVKTCPSPVRRDIAEALAPFMEEWSGHRCPIIWSPYGCEAKCVEGRCLSTK
jgi:hypothetical protein